MPVDEFPDYESVAGILQRCPETWIPGLLSRLVAIAVAKNVFREYEIATFVQQVEKRIRQPEDGVLRKETE